MQRSTKALVATRKGLFTTDVGQGEPSVSGPSFSGANVTNAVHDPRDGAWYASLDHGHFGVHLHRSDDQGVSWVEIGAPAYPPKPADVVHVNPMSQRPVAWATQLAWVIEPGHPDQPGVLWCGTIPGGLFRSADRGESWELVESHWNMPARSKWFGGGFDDAGVHSISIDPRRPGSMLVGMSCGGAWRTDDDAASWQVAARGMRADFVPAASAEDPEIQDAHRIVRCPAAPDALWTQHHCGIFRSVDNGDVWQMIPEAGPSTFGFAVAVHPDHADTAWFVPAVSDMIRVPVDGRVVVTRTRDGGASFEVLTDGLPQEHAYDLVLRHGLDVDATGEQLLLGSTTGSLWYSPDGGDSFTTVSSNLPPIHAVRWV
jgi:hypothetical protein